MEGRSLLYEMCGCQGAEKDDTISGGNGEGVPPVPIPNTEVKTFSADGTWLDTARESRSPPDSKKRLKKLGLFSLYNKLSSFGMELVLLLILLFCNLIYC